MNSFISRCYGVCSEIWLTFLFWHPPSQWNGICSFLTDDNQSALILLGWLEPQWGNSKYYHHTTQQVIWGEDGGLGWWIVITELSGSLLPLCLAETTLSKWMTYKLWEVKTEEAFFPFSKPILVLTAHYPSLAIVLTLRSQICLVPCSAFFAWVVFLFNWIIVNLWCVNFCCTEKWFSYTHTYIYILFYIFCIMVYHRILNIVLCAVQ